jgi:dTDP-4-dehydrorhamnose reductase
MRQKRVLITGGSGLLALNWAMAMRDAWDVTLVTHRHPVQVRGVNTCSFNLASPTDLCSQFRQLKPDLVVHTAGLTSVDECERSPDLAHHANAEIARNVALAAVACSASLIHISTDHLFPDHGSLYTEVNATAPINQYARTKALAETWVQDAAPTALVIRTNFFGWGHQNRQSFSDWIIQGLRAGTPLTLFDDVFFTPILADALVLHAHALLDAGASGVFHVVGDERLSKYEFALKLATRFNLSAELISRQQLRDVQLLAPRPHDMSLNNTKARALLGHRLGSVDDFLRSLQDQERAGRKFELQSAVGQPQ